MKRYKAAMDQIVVSDALRQRVLSLEKPAAVSRWRWVRPVCGAAACAVVVAVTGLWFGLDGQKSTDLAAPNLATTEAGTATGGEETADVNMAPSVREQEPTADVNLLDGMTLANPFTQWDSLEDAVATLSFEPVLPGRIAVLSGLQISTMDQMLQLCWQADGVDYCYRTAPGDDDVSGDWNGYSQTWSWILSGSEVTLKGEDDLCSLAVWQADGYSFSLSASPAVSQETLTGWLTE